MTQQTSDKAKQTHGIVMPRPLARNGYYLRDIAPEDAPAFQKLHEKMKESGQYYAYLRSFERNGETVNCGAVGERFVMAALKARQASPRTVYRFAICDAHGVVAGSAVLLLASNNRKDPRLDSGGELGCFISPEYQGHDIATMATIALARIALNELKLASFWVTTHPDNAASLQIFQKLGMRFLGETTSSEDKKMPERLLFIGDKMSLQAAGRRSLNA